MKLSFLAALPIVLATVLVGCAGSDNGDQAGVSEGAASVSDAITVQNYVSHPRIKAIRDQVAAIDHLALTKATNGGCDGSNDKYTDAQGRIRKFVSIGGEGGYAGRTTVYYNEQGKAVFAFLQQQDYTGEQANKPESVILTDSRVYFDATGKTIFEASRQMTIDEATGADWTFDNLVTAPDRLPVGSEVVESSEAYAAPDQWFAERGCGGDVENK